ncbi:hypothetical protein L3Q82_005897 [Scortum barcoo]|uniref:Uncharacterized protein n=1 Tax=Scortum barcoo TaxID=214431 RepID=A0ACB8V7B9_9TELE|nr:hypothetical protein L3Q82_005897 [Scortum barcoo]
MEHQLQQNNICGVWKGLKTISGFKEPKSQPVGDQGWANDLNLFFNRFDQASAPLPGPVSSAATPITLCAPCPLLLLCPLPSLTTFSSQPPDTSTSHSVLCTSPPSTPPCSSLLLTTHQVRNALKKNRARKAAGSGWHQLQAPEVLRRPAVWDFWFLSLKLGRVPQLWKTSCIVPVPKTPHPKELNSYRPVALTSHLMKTLGETGPRPSACPLKFSDDSAVVGLITDGDDREYRGLIQDFVDWCLRNNLQINASKTKELVVDFRRRRLTLHLHWERDPSSVALPQEAGVHGEGKKKSLAGGEEENGPTGGEEKGSLSAVMVKACLQ